jgi:hypothetical protein
VAGDSLEVEWQEISIDVEHVVRGSKSQVPKRANRYAYISGYLPGHVLVDTPQLRERRIFFWVSEGMNVRFVEDLTGSSLPVGSGWHPHPPDGMPVSKAIAWTLLTPGIGFDESVYSRYLSVQATSTVYALIGFRETVQLLRTVMESAPNVVAAEACLSLYILSPFGDSCIDALMNNARTPEMQTKVTDAVSLYAKHRRAEDFKRRPSEWVNEWRENERLTSSAGLSQDDIDFLLDDVMRRSQDPALRRIARQLSVK